MVEAEGHYSALKIKTQISINKIYNTLTTVRNKCTINMADCRLGLVMKIFRSENIPSG